MHIVYLANYCHRTNQAPHRLTSPRVQRSRAVHERQVMSSVFEQLLYLLLLSSLLFLHWYRFMVLRGNYSTLSPVLILRVETSLDVLLVSGRNFSDTFSQLLLAKYQVQ